MPISRVYSASLCLEHAFRVSEGSLSVEQRAKHSAMARYLAIDISNQLIQKYSDENLLHSNVTKSKSSKYGKKVVCFAISLLIFMHLCV